jgi:uncharacterized protein HemX
MIPLPISGAAIKAAGLALGVASLMAAGFYGGYKWQAGNVAEAKAEATEARTARDRFKANAESYQSAIAEQKAANEAAVKEAEAQKRKAAKAVADAKREKDRYERKLAEIDASIEKDKLDPECKEELERQVCGAPWK